MPYVLLILLSLGGHTTEIAVPFPDKASCEAARKDWLITNNPRIVTASCENCLQ
jgi:hypothetical protein